VSDSYCLIIFCQASGVHQSVDQIHGQTEAILLYFLVHNGELSRASAGCRMTKSDGEAPRSSSGLLGGAFFVVLRRPQDAGEAARR